MSGENQLDSTLHLVQAAIGGDQRALNELFERYLPRTRRIVACRLGWRLRQVQDHEDLVQEALLRVFQGLERFEARSEGSFRHWLSQCVECAILDAVRHSGRIKRGGGAVKRWGDLADQRLSESLLVSGAPSPSAVARAAELEERIEECLLKLPERYRELIVLRSFCGMSYAEISKQLGLENEGTVRTAYSRAVQKLRELLGA